MSKVILVIDEPNTCAECPLKVSDRLPSSCVFKRWYSLSVNDTHRTNNWCPIKPLPKRLDMSKVDGSNLLDLGYLHGRNDLINEMEGEE